MICPKCKKEIPDDSDFCQHCGCRIETESERKTRRKSMILRIVVAIAASLTVFCIGTVTYIDSKPEKRYEKAEKAFEKGNYEKAVRYYTAAGDYEDAAEKLQKAEYASHYKKGVDFLDDEDYMSARDELNLAGDFEDAADLIRRCDYNIGLSYLENEDYENAAEFLKASQYEDYNDKILEIGKSLVESGDYSTAVKIYNNAKNTGTDHYAQYAYGMVSLGKKKYAQAADYFSAAGDFKDAGNQYLEAQYNNAKELFTAKKYNEAKTAFSKAAGYKDADNLVNTSGLMVAKYDMAEGNLNAAKKELELLPLDCSYEDIDAASLLNLLDSNSDWVSVCGNWISVSGEASANCRSNITSYNGGTWTSDYNEGDYNLNISCVINNDGTVSVTGKGAILVLTEWSTIRIGVKYDEDYSINFDKKISATDFGKPIQIDEYTTLTLGKDNLSVKYYNRDSNASVHFVYTYTSNVSYQKEADA